jgi:hypothetical protein
MKRFVDWRIFCAVMIVALIVSLALHAWLGLNLWVCLGIVVVAILANGIVATIEDEMPGGLHNPKPEDDPLKTR